MIVMKVLAHGIIISVIWFYALKCKWNHSQRYNFNDSPFARSFREKEVANLDRNLDWHTGDSAEK